MLPTRVGQILRDRTGQEEDDDHGRCDPEGAVQVRITIENIEEVGPWVQSCCTATDDFVCVDVEELRVVMDRPQTELGGCAGAGSTTMATTAGGLASA